MTDTAPTVWTTCFVVLFEPWRTARAARPGFADDERCFGVVLGDTHWDELRFDQQ